MGGKEGRREEGMVHGGRGEGRGKARGGGVSVGGSSA